MVSDPDDEEGLMINKFLEENVHEIEKTRTNSLHTFFDQINMTVYNVMVAALSKRVNYSNGKMIVEDKNMHMIQFGFSAGGGSEGNGRGGISMVVDEEGVATRVAEGDARCQGNKILHVDMFNGLILWPFKLEKMQRIKCLNEAICSLHPFQRSSPGKRFWGSFGCPYLGGINCFVLVGSMDILKIYNACFPNRHRHKTPKNPKKSLMDFMQNIGFRIRHNVVCKGSLCIACLVFAFDPYRWNKDGHRFCEMGKVGSGPDIDVTVLDSIDQFQRNMNKVIDLNMEVDWLSFAGQVSVGARVG